MQILILNWLRVECKFSIYSRTRNNSLKNYCYIINTLYSFMDFFLNYKIYLFYEVKHQH